MSLAHRWPLLGNYDANVLLIALSQLDPPLMVDWWDARRSAEADMAELMQRCRAPGVLGLIVNVSRRSPWTLYAFAGRHWYSLRRLDVPGSWLDLDSDHSSPRSLSDEVVCERLGRALCEGAQILIVMPQLDDQD